LVLTHQQARVEGMLPSTRACYSNSFTPLD
jgi:hypothetical protein